METTNINNYILKGSYISVSPNGKNRVTLYDFWELHHSFIESRILTNAGLETKDILATFHTDEINKGNPAWAWSNDSQFFAICTSDPHKLTVLDFLNKEIYNFDTNGPCIKIEWLEIERRFKLSLYYNKQSLGDMIVGDERLNIDHKPEININLEDFKTNCFKGKYDIEYTKITGRIGNGVTAHVRINTHDGNYVDVDEFDAYIEKEMDFQALSDDGMFYGYISIHEDASDDRNDRCQAKFYAVVLDLEMKKVVSYELLSFPLGLEWRNDFRRFFTMSPNMTFIGGDYMDLPRFYPTTPNNPELAEEIRLKREHVREQEMEETPACNSKPSSDVRVKPKSQIDNPTLLIALIVAILFMIAAVIFSYMQKEQPACYYP